MLRISLAENSTPHTNAAIMSNEQLTEENVQVKVSTTTFTTDSIVQKQEFNTSPIKSSLYPIRDQTISDFLAKPYAITNGTWSTASVANTTLNTYNITSYLASVTQWANKIQGFNLVRGTAVVRLVANANPFQQGKLLMSFIPGGESLTNNLTRNSCRSQKTQQPNVEFDCRDSTAIIKIPYVAPTDFYDIKSGLYGWGVLTLSVLSPLNTGSGGETAVQYTVFLSFEDFELAAPIVPQSGASSSKFSLRPSKSVSVVKNDEAEAIVAQGSVSKGLSFAATVASSIATVPALTAIATPVSWVFRGLSGVASWFGWSKPNNPAPPTSVTRRLFNHMPNSTGISNAANMGLYHDSAVEVMPHMVGNDVDEMSFNYLKVRKAFCSEFSWSNASTSGTSLATFYIEPDQLFEQGSTTHVRTTTWKSYPPFAYIARFFTLWRGSLVLTLKFVKTDYHTGRIMVTFTPSSQSITLPTISTSVIALREIVDIRGQSEVVLKFPYLLNSKFLGRNSYSGRVEIMVLNELRNPETAASSIQGLCYWSAGEDFEVAVPGNLNANEVNVPFVAQVGGAQADPDQVVLDEVVGNYEDMSIGYECAKTCIGEQFSSIKQLLSRYTPLVTASTITCNANGYAGMYPFALSALSINPTTGVNVQPYIMGDALSNFAGGFAFYRGSVNILVTGNASFQVPVATILPGPANSSTTLILDNSTNYDTALTNVGDPTVVGKYLGQDTAVQVFDVNVAGFEVNIPYYNRVHMTRVDLVSQEVTCRAALDDPNSYLVYGWNASAANTHKIYRSCGDEFQLAYFLGFPPLYVSNA